MSNRKLLTLMQHPTEPTFFPKDNGNTHIDLPSNYLTNRYSLIGTDIGNRFGNNATNRIAIRGSTAAPKLDFAMGIKRRGPFSLFNPSHRQIAGRLSQLFMQQGSTDDLMDVAAYSRDRLNPVLFQYALAVAIQHRADTTDLDIPSIIQLFPDQFVDQEVFPQMREEGAVVNQANRMVIDIPQNYTASDREEEQRCAYFREDIGVNMHHWHWHLVYPGEGDISVVNKDRRGELFYFMHQQIVARYNAERFSNRLGRARALNNFRAPIQEAYFPKMTRSTNNRGYPPRIAGQVLRDLDRVPENVVVTLNDMELWTKRISDAIDAGFAVNTQNQRVGLNNDQGIDVLGNIVENSILSVNIPFYGNLHSHGHNMIAYIHDPDARFLEDYGVMGDFTTAMRDPAFYRWHTFIDDVFQRHKERLPAYTPQQLSYPGISVIQANAQLNRAKAPANVLLTYWQRSQVDLSAGLDFGPQGNVFASFTHIQHAPFSWRIQVNNNNQNVVRGTCRIYLAPKFDERGTPLLYREQRRYFIEMDKFAVTLVPGTNNIVRRDDQSSVTIPYERTFRNIGLNATPTDAAALSQFRFCGCGWPAHMLIPKGTAEGMQYEIFVMISNYADDFVLEFDENQGCNDAFSYCGLRNQKYPDRRPMGFPFDRPNTSSSTLRDFVGNYQNMRVSDVQIKFTNTVIART